MIRPKTFIRVMMWFPMYTRLTLWPFNTPLSEHAKELPVTWRTMLMHIDLERER